MDEARLKRENNYKKTINSLHLPERREDEIENEDDHPGVGIAVFPHQIDCERLFEMLLCVVVFRIIEFKRELLCQRAT